MRCTCALYQGAVRGWVFAEQINIFIASRYRDSHEEFLGIDHTAQKELNDHLVGRGDDVSLRGKGPGLVWSILTFRFAPCGL